MNTNIKVISVIDIIIGALTALGGVILFIGLIGAGSSISSDAVRISGIIGSLVVMAFGVLGIVVGIKLSEYRSWARVVQIIFGVFQLFNFPLGTAFGIYCLWAMFNDEGRALFEEDRSTEPLRRAA